MDEQFSASSAFPESSLCVSRQFLLLSSLPSNIFLSTLFLAHPTVPFP
jgi:hypothetical protein